MLKTEVLHSKQFETSLKLYPFLIKDYNDWVDFYEEVKIHPAMNKYCETGGRYLHWLGYR